MALTDQELATIARGVIRDAITDQLDDRMGLGEQLEDHLDGLDEAEQGALIDRLESAIRIEAGDLLLGGNLL